MFTINSVRAHLVLEKWKNIGGEGRNSTVWTALDKQLNEVVVLKEITKSSLDQHKVLDYFIESKMLNKANHPHVMPVRYAAEDDDNIYITMPFYHNGSINSKMEIGMLTAREIVKYSLDFLSGLIFIHIKGLLHLDIKPTNVVINDFDRAVITDFGLSRYLDENGFATQQILYRFHRSPESLETDERTVLDDIYQAGLTMYRMAYGNQTFHSQFEFLMHQHGGDVTQVFPYIKKGDFPNRSYSLPHISNKLRKTIIKAMHHDADKRYQNVLDLINDLAKVEEFLDWKFSVNSDNSMFHWSNDKETSIIDINLEQQNTDWVVSGQKTNKRSGQLLNISMANGNFSTLDLAFAHVGKLFSHFD